MMFQRIKMWFVWLQRIDKCRGFGIQSPSAYNFVCNVVNKPSNDLVYQQMRKKYPTNDQLERKKAEFVFRLVHQLEVKQCFWSKDVASLIQQYANEGNPNCEQLFISEIEDIALDLSKKSLIYVKLSDEIENFITKIVHESSAETILVIDGINEHKAQKQFWKNLQANEQTGVCFDLYYIGVVFFDKRYPHKYIVNF